YVRIEIVRIVESVVRLRQALVVSDHESGAKLVISLARGFEGGVVLPVLGKVEGLKAVGGGIAEPILQGRRKEPCPDLMRARLEGAERGIRRKWKDNESLGIDHPARQESNPRVLPNTRDYQHAL